MWKQLKTLVGLVVPAALSLPLAAAEIGAYSECATALDWENHIYNRNGGYGELAAHCRQDTPGRGSVEAKVSHIGFETYLHTYAAMTEYNSGGWGIAYTVEGFSNFGGARTVDIDVQLEGGLNVPEYTETFIGATIWVVEGAGFQFTTNPSLLPWQSILAQDSWFLDSTGVNQTLGDTLSVQVNGGGSFYVITQLMAQAATTGAVADSMHTLGVVINDTSGLTAHSDLVSRTPEPALPLLLAAGLLGMLPIGKRVARSPR